MISLTVLYTHNLRGDLDLLPRLYTFLHRLMRQFRDEDPARTVLLLDLGESCDPDVWPCTVTSGRSTLIAFDAMGYHAANCAGVLTHDARDRLLEQASMALVDAGHPHIEDGVLLVETPTEADAGTDGLRIVLTPGRDANISRRILTLPPLDTGQVGVVTVVGDPPELVAHGVRPLPLNTPPDPTIAGVVDFIRAEARYFERRRGGDE